MGKITDDDLLNYLDNELDESTTQKIKQLLTEDGVLADRMRELQTIHHFLLSQNTLEQPGKNFTDKVMAKLHEKPALTVFSPRNGLILLAGILVASGLTLTLLSIGTFDQFHTLWKFQSIPSKPDFIKIPTSFPFDLKLVLKIFLCLNLVIGFALLDRTILRPFFQKRSERYA